MPIRRRLRGDSCSLVDTTRTEQYTFCTLYSFTLPYLSSQPTSPHSIIKKYSNFVSFPVKLNGEVVNTVSAIWTMEKSAVTEEQVVYVAIC